MDFLHGLIPHGYLCFADGAIFITNSKEEAQQWVNDRNGMAMEAPIVMVPQTEKETAS